MDNENTRHKVKFVVEVEFEKEGSHTAHNMARMLLDMTMWQGSLYYPPVIVTVNGKPVRELFKFFKDEGKKKT